MFIFHNYLGTCLISANILSFETWCTYRGFLRADRQEVFGIIWLRSSVKRQCRNRKQILNPWEILHMLASKWEKCNLRNLSCPVTFGFKFYPVFFLRCDFTRRICGLELGNLLSTRGWSEFKNILEIGS